MMDEAGLCFMCFVWFGGEEGEVIPGDVWIFRGGKSQRSLRAVRAGCFSL